MSSSLFRCFLLGVSLRSSSRATLTMDVFLKRFFFLHVLFWPEVFRGNLWKRSSSVLEINAITCNIVTYDNTILS